MSSFIFMIFSIFSISCSTFMAGAEDELLLNGAEDELLLNEVEDALLVDGLPEDVEVVDALVSSLDMANTKIIINP